MAQCVPCFLPPRPPRTFRRRAARHNAASWPPTLWAVPPDGAEVGTTVSVGGAAVFAWRTAASSPYSSLLQSCIDSGSFEEGMRIHRQMLASGFQPDAYLQTKILMLYARSETPSGLATARELFDGMPQRNSTAWNTLILAYAKDDDHGEVLDLFFRMQISGVPLDGFTFPSVIKACVALGLEGLLRQIHGMVLKARLNNDLIVGTVLVEGYAQLGSMEDVLGAFSEVEGSNLVTWNAVLGGYVRRSMWDQAWEVFQTMETAGLRPNHSTLASALRACGGLGSLLRGNQVHAKLITHGFKDDIFLSNCLIDMHASCGDTGGCLKAFDLMTERDQATWNTIISCFSHLGHPEESFLQFQRMQESSFKADRFTLASLLRACACLADASYAGQLHGYLVRRWLDSDLILGSALVDLYSKIGCMEEAYAVFVRLEERNEVPWNVLISGYVQEGSPDRALEVFHRMRAGGCSPDQFTYASLLVLASELGDAELGKQIHSQVIRAVPEPSLILETELLHMHSKCGRLADALEIFSRMPLRNAYSWNSLIEGSAKNGQPYEALKLFHQMQLAGHEPDSFSLCGVLLACVSLSYVGKLKEIHGYVVKNLPRAHEIILSRVLDAYARCGSMASAWKIYSSTHEKNIDFHNAMLSVLVNDGRLGGAMEVFEQMEERNTSSWNHVLMGFMKEGLKDEAFSLFCRMLRAGVDYDGETMVPLLKICANTPSVNMGKLLHACIIKKGLLNRSAALDSAMIGMYAKGGHVEEARRHFGLMRHRSLVAWNAMISGYAQHGRSREALALFERMQTENVLPNRVTFLSLLSCCSHTGLLEEGLSMFTSMASRHGLEPRGEHYTCMVDLLGRAGHISIAKDLIEGMPIEPDASTWGALLGACRIHGDVDVARLATSKLLELDPMNAGHYILMSNIYLAAGRRGEAEETKEMMRKGARREPGVSWIEVNGEVQIFHCHDRSHARAEEMYSILRCLYQDQSVAHSRH